ncbi:MAG: hypothetical protein ABSF36_07930 [Candidatus Methanomethylicaceae archaeon]|jgi:hypothetical protein
MYLVIDIETENLGTDVMKDNKRILSVQIGDNVSQILYWADSKDPKRNLQSAKKDILSLLSEGVIFTGYNIKGFDTIFLAKFLGIVLPESNLLDLNHPQKLAELTSIRKPRLEEICLACGIDVRHKQRMNERAQKYAVKEEFKKAASAKANELVKEKGWSLDFAYRYSLDKICLGNAIYYAYIEFIDSDEPKNTLFYEYAIGDVIVEYALLKKMRY